MNGNCCDVCGWAVTGVALHRLYPPATKYLGPVRMALKLSEDADATHSCGLCLQKIVQAMPADELRLLVEAQARGLTKSEAGLSMP